MSTATDEVAFLEELLVNAPTCESQRGCGNAAEWRIDLHRRECCILLCGACKELLLEVFKAQLEMIRRGVARGECKKCFENIPIADLKLTVEPI